MKKFLKWFGIVILAIVLIICGFWLYLRERSHMAYTLPKPTGAYHVGHRMYDWTDSKHTNAFVGKSQEQRELMADVWYPTSQTHGTAAPYLPANWEKAVAENQGGGTLFERNFADIKTNSFTNATVAQGKFPVVIFQPGYGRIAADYTSYAENLASQGYVVIASSPTYISDIVVFSDGKVVKRSSKASLPENASGVSPAMQKATAYILPVMEDDDSFLIDQATALNADQQAAFYGKLDLDHVGVMGHSLGGATAYQVCKTDTRCQVAIDMDGTLFGGDAQPSRVPFLYLSSDHSKDTGDVKKEDDYNANLRAQQTQRTYYVSIADSAHFNFSDLALYSYKPAMRLLGVVGTIDGQKGVELSSSYLTDMLGKYLRAQPTHYLDAHTQPSGAMIKVYN